MEDESVNDGALTDKEKDPLAEMEPVQHPKTGEHTDDPILDSSDNEAYTTARQPPAAANPKPTTPLKEAEISGDTQIPKKAAKPSSFRKCEPLLRFLWTAACKQQFPDTAGEQLPGIAVLLTTHQAHLVWNQERHVRNSIGQQPSPAPSPVSSHGASGKEEKK
jgi:hypothetical protein